MEFSENGFEYYPEDDDLLRDDIEVAVYLENYPSETFGVAEWLRTVKALDEEMAATVLQACKPGNVLVANLPYQQDPNQSKSRPCVFLCATPHKALVFQITGFNPEGTSREDFQYKIVDEAEIGCKKASWINFDHYVVVDRNAIFRNVVGTLSERDKKGLAEKMKECITKHQGQLKYNYEQFINYLK